VARTREAKWAFGLLLLWLGLCLFTPATTTDLWTNLQLGEDLLAGEGFPDRERYSALAEGRPFVAYEWLSALVFATTNQLLGSGGLIGLRVVVGVSCLLLLYFAIPRMRRESAAFLPLLVLFTYLFCFRASVRPHLFSLLIICALCFALERWRRSRRFRDIAWLIPAHWIWANLHGAYLFGIVVMSAMAGLIAVLIAIPSLVRDEDARYQPRQLAQLAAVAAGCLLVSLINPYGVGILELSFQMSEGNEFIKEFIWEWSSPFVTGPGKTWFFLYCITLALLWFSLLLRWRSRPWIDLLLASSVTLMSCRATRFAPYLAIFAVPIVLRAFDRVFQSGGRSVSRVVERAVALAVLLLIAGTSFGSLSHYSPRGIRPLGLGFGKRLPFAEANYMKRRGLEGVIYNEYGDGAVLIYALYPRMQPIMDARIDIYGEELYLEYRRSRRTEAVFFAYLDEVDADWVLLGAGLEVNRRILKALRGSDEWELERKFPRRILYGRKS
jgi:hypothetical protein